MKSSRPRPASAAYLACLLCLSLLAFHSGSPAAGAGTPQVGPDLATVTLYSNVIPGTGQPGVGPSNVIGAGFPSGTIQPAAVTVTLKPAFPGNPTGTTPAQAVTAISGTTRRVKFQIPTSMSVTAPTSYQVSIAGSTTTGATFSSANTAALTINPPARIQSVAPNSAYAGQSLQLTITGLYTTFMQGYTQAGFGAGISVGGAPAGQLGPVTVNSPTSATATLSIGPSAAPGTRTVTVATGPQQASLTNGFTVGPAITLVSVDTTHTTAIAADFSGIDDEHLLTGVEYFDPKFVNAVRALKPGWIRFPAGTPSLAFDWQAGHMNQSWINALVPKVNSYTVAGMARAQLLTQATCGCYFQDFGRLINTLGIDAVVAFNGYTDTNSGSAAKMVSAAQSAALKVRLWELSNEAYLYPLIFPTASSYASAMYSPYFTGIRGADPQANISLFFQGQFSATGGNYAAWDNGMAAYSPRYWNAASVHVYPITDPNMSAADEQATLNGVLAHGTTEYLASYLRPLIGANTPLFISEINSDAAGMPFETYLYNGIFLAEYIARMSTAPNVKGVGVTALYLGNAFNFGMIRAVNDYESYLIARVMANPNFCTNTAVDPDTQFSFYYSAPGLTLAVANQAINNSTHIWPTTTTGGPTVPILGYDGQPIPAVFAQGYQGDNGKHYVLITNKSGAPVPVGIAVNGSLLKGTVTLSYVSNASAVVQNTAAAPNTVQIVNTTSANPLTVGPYSVTRVEW